MTDKSFTATLKLADFGMAKFLQQEEMATTHCGTPLYMAPEVLRDQAYNGKVCLYRLN